MTTLWSEVTSDDRWLALPEEAKEEIRNEYFDQVIAPEVPTFALDDVRTRFDEETSRTGKGFLNDMAERAYIGLQEMDLGLREVIGNVFPDTMDWMDSVDEWIHGGNRVELLEENIQTAYEDMSPRMRESMRKDWWDEEEGKLGLAAYDPYAYIGGIAASAPETFATMVPAFKIGKMIYGAQRAKGLSQAAAAAKAATGAQIAGSVLEGGMAGGHASRSVRQELEELPENVWENSDLYQELVNSGLSPEEAKANIMDSSATQAMLMATAVTGAFGGFGDRVLTQGVLRGLKGGIGQRMATGAVAEGVLEEAPQEAGSQIAENIAIQQVDPARETMAGAIGAAIGGAAVGGPMGAGFGAVSRRQPVDPVAEIAKAETVDEAVDAAVTATEPMPGEREDMQRVMQEASEARMQADAEQRTREFLEQEQARASQIPEDQAATTQEGQEPAASQDVGRQDRELPAEERMQVGDETPPKEPGQRQRVGNEDSVVVDAQRIGGVDYELYGPTKFRGKWSARVHDVDSGETVGIRQFDSRADARAFHAANIQGAQAANAEQAKTAAPAAQETARASIQAPENFAKTRIYDPAPPTVVRGSTQSVRENLAGSFGEPLISALEEKGYLSIEQEVPVGNDPATQGLLDNDQIRLFANNIDRADDALASAVLLHEGEHLGMQPMLGKSYGALQGNLDSLVAAGDESAVAAAGRVPEGVPAEDVGSERLAYFIEEAHQRIQDRQPISNRAMELFRQIMAQLKAWFRQTRVGQAAANAGIDWQLTDDYAVALARKALEQVAARTEPRTPGPLRRQAESRAATAPRPQGFGQSIDPDVQKRLEAALADRSKKLVDKVKEGVKKSFAEFTRAFPKLDKKRFGAVLDILRQWKNVPEYSHKTAAEEIYGFVKDMDEQSRFVYTMNIVLPDMMRDVESGLLDDTSGYPFGYKNREMIEADLRNFQQQAQSDTNITRGLAKRKAYMRDLREKLIDAKLLKEEVRDNDDYYHHQVLDYLALKEDASLTAGPKEVRTHKAGWQKARKGSSLDYNLEYLEAEFEVISQAISQLRTKELLDRIGRKENIRPQLKQEADEWNIEWMRRAFPKEDPDSFTKKEMKDAMGKAYKEFDDMMDISTHAIWRPTPGSAFYKTNSIHDKVIEDVLNGYAELSRDDVKEVLARGKDVEWVLPKELAETLDDPAQFPSENTIVGKTSARVLSSWKQWTLLNPFRVVRYNLNNMSGDLDIALAYDWRILKYFKQAFKDLRQYRLKPEDMSADLKKELDTALKLGAINSGFVVHEVQDFSKQFKDMMNPSPNMLKRYWNKTQDLTNFRENWLRLASFRYFKDRIARGDQGIYGASMKAEVDAVTNPTERAAKLSRELIGDYGNISHAGQYMRRHMIPFYSWLEINAPRYVRLMKNMKHEEGRAAGGAAGVTAWKATKLGAKMAMFAAVVMMFNRAVFPDEEEELSDAQRRQMHLILGRREDGSIRTLRLQGAFSDALAWFGGEDLPADISDLASGKTDWNDYLLETAGAAPSKLWHGAKPIEKTIAETVIGKTTWPYIMSPRPIRDRWEHVARAVSFGIPYRHAMGLPSRGFGADMQAMLTYNTDPGEAAYHDIRAQMFKFLDKNNVERVSGTPTTRGNALYYYKQAMRFGDLNAAEKYRQKYFDLGGTRRGMMQSIKLAAPMSVLPKKWRRLFLAQLSEKDKEVLSRATLWYRNTYRGRGI